MWLWAACVYLGSVPHDKREGTSSPLPDLVEEAGREFWVSLERSPVQGICSCLSDTGSKGP